MAHTDPLTKPTPEDAGRVLKQILDRLDAIEKRLENIEKMLTRNQRAP